MPHGALRLSGDANGAKAKERRMGIWKRTGFSSYGLEDLTPESRKTLSGSHGLDVCEPLLLNPDMLD